MKNIKSKLGTTKRVYFEMKSLKSILAISAFCLVILAGCSNGNSRQNVGSSISNSTSKNIGSSVIKSSSSSSEKKIQISNKEAGVLAWKLVNSNFFDEQIKGGMYYGTNSKNSDAMGYDYITANGDVTSNLYYKVNGDQLTYRTWVVKDGQATMDGHYKTVTVSLQSLIDKFYSNSSQQSKVQADANALRPYTNN